MYEKTLSLYDQAVEKCPRFERKGKTMPYTSSNGHMFSLLNKAGELGIRFSKEVQKKYLDEFETTTFESYGATMRGYILVPDAIVQDEDRLVALLNEGYEYVMSLEPK